MSRYSAEELSFMARQVRLAEERGSDRAFRLYLTIADVTGMDPNQVRQRVRAYEREVPRGT